MPCGTLPDRGGARLRVEIAIVADGDLWRLRVPRDMRLTALADSIEEALND